MPTKVHLVKAMVFPVIMYGCESWTIKKAEGWIIDVLNCGFGEDSWLSLDCKEIQPVHPKGDQSWVLIGRTEVEVETPIFWPPNSKSWLIWKHPDAGKDWGQEEKGTKEDEMVEWHHWLSGCEFEHTQGDSEGQESLACSSSWACKELDTTQQLSNTTYASLSIHGMCVPSKWTFRTER